MSFHRKWNRPVPAQFFFRPEHPAQWKLNHMMDRGVSFLISIGMLVLERAKLRDVFELLSFKTQLIASEADVLQFFCFHHHSSSYSGQLANPSNLVPRSPATRPSGREPSTSVRVRATFTRLKIFVLCCSNAFLYGVCTDILHLVWRHLPPNAT